MGLNKNAILRYFLIDFKLHQSTPPTTDELKIYLEESFLELTGKVTPITKLSVKNDIKNMRKVFFTPIKFSFDTNRYFYEDPNNQTFLKFPAGAGDYFLIYLRLHFLFGNRYEKEVYIYSGDKKVWGGEHLEIFTRAILEKKKIKFTQYKSYNAKRLRDYTIHPYLLREHRNAWYIIGKKVLDGEMRHFALHRIEGLVEILSEPAEIDEAYNRQIMLEVPSTLFSLGNRLLEITIEGSINVLTEIQAIPLHSSQTILTSNEIYFRISLHALPTEEMISEILKYGDKLEVISPEKFRSFVADRISILFKKYTGPRA